MICDMVDQDDEKKITKTRLILLRLGHTQLWQYAGSTQANTHLEKKNAPSHEEKRAREKKIKFAERHGKSHE